MGLIPILDVISKVIDNVIPDPDKKMAMKIELAKLADQEAARESQERIAQTEVNKAEANHSAIFVAGWRPAVGWVCVIGLLYTIVVSPITGLPVSDTPFLRDILLGILGINVTARSLEKLKGVAQNTLTGNSPIASQDAVTPVNQIAPKPKKRGLDIWPF